MLYFLARLWLTAQVGIFFVRNANVGGGGGVVSPASIWFVAEFSPCFVKYRSLFSVSVASVLDVASNVYAGLRAFGLVFELL
jgi:hypothetical protein